MTLTVLPHAFAIWKLPTAAPLPQVPFFAAIRTDEELTLVTEEGFAPKGVPCERGWRGLKLAGPMDLTLTGVLASLAVPLAEAGIAIFVVSTFDTDYILVKEARLDDAIATLATAGHTVA